MIVLEVNEKKGGKYPSQIRRTFSSLIYNSTDGPHDESKTHIVLLHLLHQFDE